MVAFQKVIAPVALFASGGVAATFMQSRIHPAVAPVAHDAATMPIAATPLAGAHNESVATSPTLAVPPPAEAVKRAADAAMAHQTASLEQRCYAPQYGHEKLAVALSYRYHLTFNARGQAIARGIEPRFTEKRAGPNPERQADVLACLNSEPLALEIDPPGRNVAVEVLLTLGGTHR